PPGVEKLLADCKTVHSGHHQIEDHQVRLFRPEFVQPILTIPCGDHRIFMRRQHRAHCVEDIRIVIDEQYLCFLFHLISHLLDFGSRQKSRFLHDNRYYVFPAHRHYMDSVNFRYLHNLINYLKAYLQSLFFNVGSLLQPGNHLVGNGDPGDVVPHVAGHTCRFYRYDSSQNVHPLVKALVFNQLHPPAEFGDIEHCLRLYKINARPELSCKPGHAVFKRICKWVFDSSDKNRELSVDILAADEFALIAHSFQCVDELSRIQVVDPLGSRMVAEGLVIPRQAENISYAHRHCSQDIALQSDAVAVAHDHLQHRVNPHPFKQSASGETAHPDYGSLIVGNIDGVSEILELFALLQHSGSSCSLGRTHFGRNREPLTLQHFLKISSCFHGRTSPLSSQC